jgi:hypothetical protein
MSLLVKVRRNSGSRLALNLPKTMVWLSERSRNSVQLFENMSKKSETLGKSTSEVEVTNISAHGFWLYLAGRELFVSFSEFPWFAEAPIRKITRVEWPSPDHLHWPELDVDLSVRSIENPEHFPLKSAPSK